MTEDNWCKIQRKYGEDFLSEVCMTYPRRIYRTGNFYESTLTLTCPVAAEIILFAEEPLNFEEFERLEPINSRIITEPAPFDPNTIEYIIDIQKTAIFILQERKLTIDQRLMMMGLYLDRLSELTDHRSITNLELTKLNDFYKNSSFLQDQASQFSAVINFNAKEYIKITIGLLETLYGVGSEMAHIGLMEQKIIRAVTNTLKLEPDENNQISASGVAVNYAALNFECEKFIRQFSTIFENYLVNEFFLAVYPFRFNAKINLNYGIFVTTYKMLELMAFSVSMQENFSKQDLMNLIVWYSNFIDHSPKYFKAVSDYMKDKNDILAIMQEMLQV